MPSSTSRLALPYPIPGDPNNVPADIQRLAAALDTVGVVYASGTAATRPAAMTVGRFYLATDTSAISFDTGSTWITINSSLASVLQNKGDLLVASAANAAARLAAGTDGQALVSRASATNGLAWENQLGQPLALAGAGSATRWVGATTSGAPTTGTWAVGDWVIGQNGTVSICTTAGTPGTWSTSLSIVGASPVPGATLRGGSTPGTIIAQAPIEAAWERTGDMTGTPVADNTGTFTGTIPTDTLTPMPWQTSDGGSGFTWSASTNPSRVTITQAGKYTIAAQCRWKDNQYNGRGIHLRVNGSAIYHGAHDGAAPRGNSPSTAVGNSVEAEWARIPLSAGDYVEILVYQDSNGNLDALAGNHGIRLTARYTGP